MVKVALVFLLALGVGYSYGYGQAAKGTPSVMQRIVVRFGVTKIAEDQKRREQATDAVR